MNKVVYLIASHKNPAQTARLATILCEGSPDAVVVIHHDASVSSLDKKTLRTIKTLRTMPNVIVIEKTVSVQWGDFSAVQMVLHCLQFILEEIKDFKWFVFVSGQDYPLKPIREIEKELEITKYDGFMTHYSLETGDAIAKKLISERYYYRYYKLPKHWRITNILSKFALLNERQSLIRIFPGLRNANPRIGLKRFKPIFSKNFTCYKGQFWMTLNKKSVMYLMKVVEENPEIVEYYKHTFIPDESFFQTVLVNNCDLLIANDHLRYIDWSGSNLSHPKLLDVSDFDCLSRSNKHFARKLDIEVDNDIFEKLDERVVPKNLYNFKD